MITRTIPYVDVARQHAAIRDEILEAVGRVLDHGRFILGPEVTEFEERFAELIGTRFATALNSGTDALLLGLRALGIGAGDEVITVPNSFVASTAVIKIVGARPVFVDVDDTMNMDPELVEAALTPRTRAILVVHLTGRPANMTAICEIAQRRGLLVIEDAAQSALATHRGRFVGSFGSVGCFSLHPLKTLNACGDGGVATTDDSEIHRQLTILRNIGLASRDDAVAWSGNSRLDTIQAAILLVKLRHVNEWTERRRQNAAYYQGALAPYVRVPRDVDGDRSVYHLFVIQAERRNDLRKHLAERGVETAIHYPIPIHLTTIGRTLGHRRGDFPVTERQAETILSLPIYPELSSEDLEAVARGIRSFYAGDVG